MYGGIVSFTQVIINDFHGMHMLMGFKTPWTVCDNG
jgi:hypothetical protein